MKFLKMSVLFLALLGVLIPPPALAVAASPMWIVTTEVNWKVPDGWNDTIRDQVIRIEVCVWTAYGPTYRTVNAKIGDEYAITWVEIGNGWMHGDNFITEIQIPYIKVRSQPAPSTNTVWIVEEYGLAFNHGFCHWHTLVKE
jgi:hypothetical protein